MFKRVIYLSSILLLIFPCALFGADTDIKPEIIASRVKGNIIMDGRLSEPAWEETVPVKGLFQREPLPGEMASELSEVRVLFDDEYLYIGAILYDSEPEKLVADEMKRDADLRRNDAFAILIDTYHDHRNGFFFETNPVGARADAFTTDEGTVLNFDWDGVWWVETLTASEGWMLEMKIPFSTLRFDEERVETWGVTFRRIIRRKNEEAHWPYIPLDSSIWRVSRGGHLKGLNSIRQGRDIEIKPYLLGGFERLQSKGEDETEFVKDGGVDIKYSISPNITLDITVNTDFAHVEADEQQINLTRFPLFFPEKREFFLEGGGYFDFGVRGRVQPFFSRRIGLVAGKEIPILMGGKVTGKEGRYGMGILSVQTRRNGAEPEANYSVVRLKRDIMERSSIGIIAVNKEAAGDHYNRTFGVDARFSILDHLDITSFLFKTETEGASGDGDTGYLKFRWEDDIRLLTLSYLDVEDDVNPEVGFVRRRGIKETIGHASYEIRPVSSPVRDITPFVTVDYLQNQDEMLITRSVIAGVSMEFQSGDLIKLYCKSKFERLDDDFSIRSGISIPQGDYNFDSYTLYLATDRGRKLSGDVSITSGEFWSGDILSYGASIFYRPSKNFGIDLGFDRDEVDLPQGSFDSELISSKIEYYLSTRSFLNALLQWNYDVDEFTANLRYNYEYMPGSDIYLVYNERRDLGGGGPPDRSLLLKYTYLWSL